MTDSKMFGAEGGKARAKGMTPEERSEGARIAAQARWVAQGKLKYPKATHEGPLNIGGIDLWCAVLDDPDRTRVLSRASFVRAIGRKGKVKGGRKYDEESKTPVFLTAANLKDFFPNDLDSNSRPILYKPLKGPSEAIGYRADFLPVTCGIFVDAKIAGALQPSQEDIAIRCQTLQKGFARVGIIALVDEATGYQYDRPKRELEEYLKKYLSENLRRWVRTFPSDYFKHLCRLRGVELRPDMKLPQYFGHLTNDLVFNRIAPGLLRRLKQQRDERGRPSNKLHQWTSEDHGYPELLIHLGTVVGLMKTHTNYDSFKKQLDQVAPVFPEVPGLFDDPSDWE